MSTTPNVRGNIGTRSGVRSGDVAASEAAEATMRAVVQDTYGSPDVLEVAAVPMPTPGPGQVRVRVAAASVNARDWHVMRGEPRLARLLDRTVFGRTAPRVAIRGTDFAGTVDAVGAGVTRWQPGDPVFGKPTPHSRSTSWPPRRSWPRSRLARASHRPPRYPGPRTPRSRACAPATPRPEHVS